MKSPVNVRSDARLSQEQMVDYVRDLAEEDVWYCPNPGNAGDSIIAHGTYALFRQAGLSHHIVEWDEAFDSTGKVLLYAGGGNLNSKYPHAHGFIKRHHRNAKRLVLLPHTVEGRAQLLVDLGDNVDLLCREERTYQWVQDKAPRANAFLADDLAFHVDPDEVLRGARGRGELAGEILSNGWHGVTRRMLPVKTSADGNIPLRATVQQGPTALRQLFAPPNGNTLYALRSDVEAAGGELPRHNLDLSQVFAYGTVPERVAGRATRAMFSFIDRFERIITNRLHVCVPAALLGKEVNFYANDYFKNEAVYEFSMRDQYPNVTWCGTWPGAQAA
jgi:exopolysaccharide biosynthesis predicted pyruvyltransferase EpsI